MAKNDFQYGGWKWNVMAYGSGIVTVNSPSGSSTLQCDKWLWDDMPLNSPKRPPYWKSTSGYHFHTSPQSKRRGGGMRGKGLGRGLCQKKNNFYVPKMIILGAFLRVF